MPSNDAFGFELTGVKEMMRLLEQLPTVAMQKTVVRNALKKSAKPMLESAKDHCPKGPTGNLGDSLQISTKLKTSQKRGRWQDRSTVTVYLGSNAPHAHLVEFGTTTRVQKGTGRATGQMPPNPFLRQAWDGGKMQALKAFAREIEKELVKAARRLRKKAETGKLGKAQRRGLLR